MHKRSLCSALVAAALLTPILSALSFAEQPAPRPTFFHPGSTEQQRRHKRGFEFTVPQVDDLADFHGDITDPKLVLYVGGIISSQWPLVAAFEKQHPDYKGRSIGRRSSGPARQADGAGGTITSGNMT